MFEININVESSKSINKMTKEEILDFFKKGLDKLKDDKQLETSSNPNITLDEHPNDHLIELIEHLIKIEKVWNSPNDLIHERDSFDSLRKLKKSNVW